MQKPEFFQGQVLYPDYPIQLLGGKVWEPLPLDPYLHVGGYLRSFPTAVPLR
jgi:hypothetical protein